jgi:hypothetical protein
MGGHIFIVRWRFAILVNIVRWRRASARTFGRQSCALGRWLSGREGFDTPDLKQAKALLDELGPCERSKSRRSATEGKLMAREPKPLFYLVG